MLSDCLCKIIVPNTRQTPEATLVASKSKFKNIIYCNLVKVPLLLTDNDRGYALTLMPRVYSQAWDRQWSKSLRLIVKKNIYIYTKSITLPMGREVQVSDYGVVLGRVGGMHR